MRILYLHGFASSPRSRKAQFFIGKFAAEGLALEALELAPDFEHSTVSRQLAILETAVAGKPAQLIGSSLGGYLAALFAERHPHLIERLVLLAPAFDFYTLWKQSLGGEQLEAWRATGKLPIFHYGQNGYANLGFEFIQDAERHSAFPDVRQPCLIFHGLNDTVVPHQKSVRFAAQNPQAQLVELESGHELTDVLDEIWRRLHTFLLNGRTSLR